ncbi:signal peptidase II [Thiovibrio frasassiensis]|uniref:Lipoprotein signal peptidase n=1 Tax=Thiovibrio frasassiensis TaxID=2984131 RepID=A0A9X4MK60_9BACT|nr:signal peptidase II [Thiovibrio frasassiensis]MDG4477013.1 signal peptidase II [Thiovibrio frasassiensis]
MNKNELPIIPLAWLLAVVLLDQLSKGLVMAYFAMYELRPVIPGLFNLTYLTNTGAAFGMLAGAQSIWRQVFFVGAAVVAIGIMVFSYRQFRSQGKIFAHAIGLVAGGAAGNLIDRLRFGAVVDFLDFYVGTHHWPAFNVADSAITVGVGLFILGTILYPPKESEK